MIEEDLEHLREVLAHAVEASSFLRRDIERALRVRNGSLRQLLDGSLDVQVEHLTAFARMIQFPAGDLLALGCPATRAAATRRLADWLEPAPGASATPPSLDEVAAMVRSALREELALRRNR